MIDYPQSPHEHAEPGELTETELRVRALQTVLVQKGYIDSAAVDLLFLIRRT